MKKFIITEDDKKHIIGLYESAPKTTDFIKQTNNKEILQSARKIINSEIKQSTAQSFILVPIILLCRLRARIPPSNTCSV